MPEHIDWRDVIQVDPDNDLLVYDLSAEEFQGYVEQVEAFLEFVECTDLGQGLLLDIQKQQAANNDGEKIHLKLSDNTASGAAYDGTIVINTNTPDYIAFIDQASGQAMPVSLERVVFHELSHVSDKRFADAGGDVLSEEFSVQRTDAFACAYMPSMGQRVAYLNGAGEVPEQNSQNNSDGEEGVELIKDDAYTQGEIEDALKGLPERIADALKDDKTYSGDVVIPEPCSALILKN